MVNLFWLKRFETLLDKYEYLGVIRDIQLLDLNEAWSLYIYLSKMEGE